jgi:hypothetical protein
VYGLVGVVFGTVNHLYVHQESKLFFSWTTKMMKFLLLVLSITATLSAANQLDTVMDVRIWLCTLSFCAVYSFCMSLLPTFFETGDRLPDLFVHSYLLAALGQIDLHSAC